MYAICWLELVNFTNAPMNGLNQWKSPPARKLTRETLSPSCVTFLLVLKPFLLSSPFSITQFDFFLLHVLLTRASLLALAKSIISDLFYMDTSLIRTLRFVPPGSVLERFHCSTLWMIHSLFKQTIGEWKESVQSFWTLLSLSKNNKICMQSLFYFNIYWKW